MVSEVCKDEDEGSMESESVEEQPRGTKQVVGTCKVHISNRSACSLNGNML